jgi:hypothetical protein
MNGLYGIAANIRMRLLTIDVVLKLLSRNTLMPFSARLFLVPDYSSFSSSNYGNYKCF